VKRPRDTPPRNGGDEPQKWAGGTHLGPTLHEHRDPERQRGAHEKRERYEM
jgi:hypothetical protein